MIEKLNIKGSDIWIIIEPHVAHSPGDDPKEFFTASYHVLDPVTYPGGTLLLDSEGKPMAFDSPVQALEYASEKLAGDEVPM
jgi:hypothetical protein